MLVENTPELTIMVGIPGVGKSTYRDKIINDHIVLSSDDIIEEFALREGKTYDDVFNKYVKTASNILQANAKEAFKHRHNVVWDQTNLSVKSRRKILKMVPDEYYKIAVAFEPIDMDVIWQRLERRSKETGKTIPKHVIENMIKNYSPPTKNEGFDKVIIIR